MKFSKIPIFILAAAMSASTLVVANDDDGDEELEFDEAKIFFELNNTDGDLGIHALIDGEPWKKLEIEDPKERTILKIRVKGRLRKQGLTELFFESAEPTFDELTPADFFARFPEGEYEVEGKTLDGEELEAEVEISHVMPAPVGDVMIGGEEAAKDCDDEDNFPDVSGDVDISWKAVTTSHPGVDIDGDGEIETPMGTSGDPEVVIYVLVVEDDADEGVAVMSMLIPAVKDAESYSLTVPNDFMKAVVDPKYEIIAISDTGNSTATESCFEHKAE